MSSVLKSYMGYIQLTFEVSNNVKKLTIWNKFPTSKHKKYLVLQILCI